MLKEIFLINANGQMEINFDALEFVTNHNFVKEVKYYLSEGYSVIKYEKSLDVTEVIMKYHEKIAIITCLEDYQYANVVNFSRFQAERAFEAAGWKL